MLAEGVVEAFQIQAFYCRKLGSELYGDLLDRAIADVRAGGPIGRLLDGWVGQPLQEALVLRLLGAVHERVLAGRAPELARYYPSVGGRPQWPAAWEGFLGVVESQNDVLRPRLDAQVQTNEVSRCAALLGGFLEVAARTGLPLRLMEIGASAGLNLLWDRYRYELGPHVWGDPASPVLLRAAWKGPAPKLAAAIAVAGRRGCDLAPVDISDPEQVRRLESFIWPDQLERMAQLRGAVEQARRERPAVDRLRAVDWLRENLSPATDGLATVVFHSAVWWYLPEDERDAVTRILREAGEGGSERTPLAWLRMEPMGSEELDVTLTSWPSGDERLLGRAHPHGRAVEWR